VQIRCLARAANSRYFARARLIRCLTGQLRRHAVIHRPAAGGVVDTQFQDVQDIRDLCNARRVVSIRVIQACGCKTAAAAGQTGVMLTDTAPPAQLRNNSPGSVSYGYKATARKRVRCESENPDLSTPGALTVCPRGRTVLDEPFTTPERGSRRRQRKRKSLRAAKRTPNIVSAVASRDTGIEARKLSRAGFGHGRGVARGSSSATPRRLARDKFRLGSAAVHTHAPGAHIVPGNAHRSQQHSISYSEGLE